MSRLCPVCRKIPFPTLTCPTASDLREAHAMRKKGRQTQRNLVPFDDFSDVKLGSLGKIKFRAQQEGCQLCSLFYDTIKRRGALYVNGRPIPEDDDNIIIGTGCDRYSSYVSENAADFLASRAQALFLIRRIGLYVRVAADTEIDGVVYRPEQSLACFSNVAQACYYDDFNPAPTPAPVLGLPDPSSTASIDGQLPRLLFSARKRPQTVDVQLLKKWMNICLIDHDVSCSTGDEDEDDKPPSVSSVELIRFVDVDRNCLKVLRDVDIAETPYLALSYCWGRDQTVKLYAENEEAYQQENSLPMEGLPQTIQDAIELTRALGFKYVWIDVICIMQGQTEVDKHDRGVQLGNAGMIYKEANTTIVAACGDTADAGLSGLRPGTRTFEQQAVQVISQEEDPIFGGLGLVSTCFSIPPWTPSRSGRSNLVEDLEWSAWSTRAWTFQEHILSRRRLIFTPDRVQWCCDGAIFSEESHFEVPELYQRGVFDMPVHVQDHDPTSPLSVKTIDGYLARLTTNRRTFWTKLDMQITRYSDRQMSYEGDIYSAFKGILDAFTNISEETFHWGHPRSRFALSLGWSSHSSAFHLRRRTAVTTVAMTSLNRQVQLPSWSWMGWVGLVRPAIDSSRAEFETPEVTCFEHSSSPLSITRVLGSNRFDVDDYFHKPTPEEWKPAWKQGRDDDEVTVQDIQTHLPELTEPFLQQHPDGHILFFWASSAVLNVQAPPSYAASKPPSSKSTPPSPSARDKGVVTAPDGTPIGTVDAMGPNHWDQTEDPSGRHEFVVVGRRAFSEVPDMPPMVLALQIRWEKGLAVRVNIAEIDEEAWIRAGPTWRLVAMM